MSATIETTPKFVRLDNTYMAAKLNKPTASITKLMSCVW
ncbi:hypothetical protein BMY_0336 [Wohlfahrtiimonas chitiniclastica]|nr:hypothetical protein BMY_0336 [Wohlfahrtiimonas chitiniclastica]